jgi:hypothetical protein
MTQPSKTTSKLADSSNNPQIGERVAAIADVTDALDGATFTGTALTTSATPTVTELEAAVGVIGGKLVAILAALRNHGLIAD